MAEINLSIAIYEGIPLDYQKYRHTALCLRPTDGGEPMIIHASGPKMEYVLNTRDNYDPASSQSLAKEVAVGRVTTPMTKPQLVAVLYQTPVDNRDPEFDCQKWVGDALQRLASAGHISQEDCDGGIDRMVEATMEAKHEPK